MADKEKKYSDIDLSKYASGFQGSDALTQAGTNKQNAVNAYSDFVNKGFSSEKQGLADSVLNQYLNRDPFSYDFNADVLYQQYKDKYIQQGKMAMQDTMGQAAAMTGGYGNSYAATVGNQAYQAHLQNLNDIIPELCQLAYDRYNQEGQNMLNKHSLLDTAIDNEYGMWSDKLGILKSDRDYYGQEESNLFNREYGTWNDNRTFDQNQYWNEVDLYFKDQEEKRKQEAWELEKAEMESDNSPFNVYSNATPTSTKKSNPFKPAEITAPFTSAGVIVDAMVKTGTVAKGKTVDKGTASGQRELSSAINKEINAAVKAGEITREEANVLKQKYNRRGYTK